MKKKIYLLIIVLLANLSLSSQHVFKTELRSDSADYFPETLLQNADSTFMVGGDMDGVTTSDWDGFIAKYSKRGDLLWLKNIPLPDFDFNTSIIHGADSGYLMCATTYSYPIPDDDSSKDIIALKLDTSGKEVWRKVLAANDYYSSIASPDGGYVILGDVWLPGQKRRHPDDISDFILYKLSATGTILWTKTFGTYSSDNPWHSKLYCDENSNIYFGAHTDSATTNYLHGLFYKFDPNGNLVYRKFFKESLTDRRLVGPKQIFKFKGKHYYNRENAVYQIDLNTGLETLINQFINLKQISVHGNNITAIAANKLHEQKEFQMLRLNDSFEIYWSKTIKAVDEAGGRIYAQRTVSTFDNGNAYLFKVEEAKGRYKGLFIKTDCNGNYDKWRECTLGDEEIKQIEKGIRVYPNPASVKITVEFDVTPKNPMKFKLYNIEGQVMCEGILNQDKTDIDIALWAKGMYFLLLGSGEGTTIIK